MQAHADEICKRVSSKMSGVRCKKCHVINMLDYPQIKHILEKVSTCLPILLYTDVCYSKNLLLQHAGASVEDSLIFYIVTLTIQGSKHAGEKGKS